LELLETTALFCLSSHIMHDVMICRSAQLLVAFTTLRRQWMLFNKPISQLERDDLQRLIDDGVLEKKRLDYKLQFTGNSDGDKKELLYDLSSFANAGGGYLIFGMREQNGTPVSIEGIDPDAVDREKLRMEQLLQTGVEPRIPGITMHNIPLDNGKAAFIVHIPGSWVAPHMVKLSGVSRFYSRNSAGKYQLDVSELRAAFQMSETLGERIRNFRTERLGKIIANELPIEMPNNPKIVLHVIPISAFSTTQFGQFCFPEDKSDLEPINSRGFTTRINFEGLLVYTPYDGGARAISYTQLYRNGIIEAVESYILNLEPEQQYAYYISWVALESKIISAVQRFLKQLTKMEIEPPALLMLSILNVKGWMMPQSEIWLGSSEKIDRDNLIIPDVLVDNFNIDADIIMKNVFDALWNAAGFEKSRGYDENGRWVGNRR
jgi:hypothetical protein